MSAQSFWNQHYFLLRRLHSLTGIVPIGVFLIAHLTTNSTILWGMVNARADTVANGDLGGRAIATFQEEVAFINGLPALPLIEYTLWGSIAFHSILGFVYAFSGKRNTERYAYQDNWRYTLQRWTGYLGVLFIVYHVATLRWGWDFLTPADTKWSHHFSASTLAAALRGDAGEWSLAGLIVALLYFFGVTALVYHFANGLWTAAITWGLTISKQAQQRWGYACAALGVGLMGAGWASIGGFLLMDHDEALAIETRLLLEQHSEEGSEDIGVKYLGEDEWERAKALAHGEEHDADHHGEDHEEPVITETAGSGG